MSSLTWVAPEDLGPPGTDAETAAGSAAENWSAAGDPVIALTEVRKTYTSGSVAFESQ